MHNAVRGFVLNEIQRMPYNSLFEEILRSDGVTSNTQYGIEQGGSMFMEKRSQVLPESCVQFPLITSSYCLSQNGTAAPRCSPR